MLLSVIAERAVRSCGRGIRYRLGHGGMNPLFEFPTQNGYCDCSGFVAWCLSLTRAPKPSRPWWLETTRIHADATGKQSVFVRTPHPVRGGLVVFPDRTVLGVRRQGHIGVIVTSGDGWEVCDCSPSNERRLGDAIAIRDGRSVFGRRKDAVFCILRESK